MVTRNHIQVYRSLVPMSLAYGMGSSLRNMLYDKQWLQSKSYPLPVICVGNLAVGGTGKTPHTEYLIQLLQAEGLHVATLSRGYKRQTKGYLKATPQSTAEEIGDEPWQLKHNHPKAVVAVDEDRCHGIEQLMEEQHPYIDAIILDDAYQHRAVKAGLYILLTDYHRLYTEDMLLPAGRLRERKQGAERAQIVIVTKCPDNLTDTDYETIRANLQLLPHQQLFFSAITYGEPTPVFKQAKVLNAPIGEETSVLAVTGIAHPEPLANYLRSLISQVELLSYPDHHTFTDRDLQTIDEKFAKLSGKRLIITTQKDAARLQGLAVKLSDSVKSHLYALPIGIRILRDQEEIFNRNIIDYANQDSRNR